jgi:hypothetical protein
MRPSPRMAASRADDRYSAVACARNVANWGQAAKFELGLWQQFATKLCRKRFRNRPIRKAPTNIIAGVW